MNKDNFLKWKKENFPAQCFIEDMENYLLDEMLDAPIDFMHTPNYFWKALASFCLEQIE